MTVPGVIVPGVIVCVGQYGLTGVQYSWMLGAGVQKTYGLTTVQWTCSWLGQWNSGLGGQNGVGGGGQWMSQLGPQCTTYGLGISVCICGAGAIGAPAAIGAAAAIANPGPIGEAGDVTGVTGVTGVGGHVGLTGQVGLTGVQVGLTGVQCVSGLGGGIVH